MIRDAYISWTRRAVLVLASPLLLTTIIQALSSRPQWASGPAAPLGVRSLFVAAGVAAIAYGRGIRQRDTRDRPLTLPSIVSLSWKLVVLSVIPAAAGAVLALMTRNVLDYYLLLLVTLVALVLLYPRYDQWVAWASPGDGER